MSAVSKSMSAIKFELQRLQNQIESSETLSTLLEEVEIELAGDLAPRGQQKLQRT